MCKILNADTDLRLIVNPHRTVEVVRAMNAPAERVFNVLVDPRRHVEIDGSNMVQGVGEVPRRLTPGVEFAMAMRQSRFSYRSVNRVVEFQQNRRLTWETTGRWRGWKIIGGQLWRYELIPLGRLTLVRHSYVWGRARLALLTVWLPGYPRRMKKAMAASLARLADAVDR